MKILLTGIAGFIGSHAAKTLIEEGHEVIGLDNLNDYYDVSLKEARLKNLVPKEVIFVKGDILDKELLDSLAQEHSFDVIIHLAAQAGVRYSLENPDTYIQTNVQGTNNIFELARKYDIKRAVYASSSSVYGGNDKIPFSETDSVDNPISLYAATKKANELQANVYSHLFGLTTIGLRFFTVYGLWGRPDMALFKFTKGINEEKSIDVYNKGNMKRDFTYVKDIVDGIVSTIDAELTGFNVFNLGRGESVNLMDFIGEIESNLDKKAKLEFLPMQPGDVPETFSDVSKAKQLLNYNPSVSIKEGVNEFVNWYLSYFEK
ncbi:GDP-mannose 4,6-dehydratase [Candidatus Woesearchaeota archaeon]|nr:GDP-mannose 4,6-dehydratase [Candidatus Woesearchaeota archaeon]